MSFFTRKRGGPLTRPGRIKIQPKPPQNPSLANIYHSAQIRFRTNLYEELEKNLPADQKPEVIILGRGNVGKSTLMNFISARHKLVQISKDPGHTKEMAFANIGGVSIDAATSDSSIRDAAAAAAAAAKRGRNGNVENTGGFRLVDSLGYGHSSQPEWGSCVDSYLQHRSNLRGVLFLVDARFALRSEDFTAISKLEKFNRPFNVLLTKIDYVLFDTRNLAKGKIINELSGLKQWQGIMEICPRVNYGIERAQWLCARLCGLVDEDMAIKQERKYEHFPDRGDSFNPERRRQTHNSDDSRFI